MLSTTSAFHNVTRSIECLAITPVGPHSNIEHVLDTVDSFLHYMPSTEAIMMVLDDTGADKLSVRLHNYDNARVFAANGLRLLGDNSYNTYGSLFVKQIRALDAVTREYEWKCLLRLDDDALLLGPAPYREALSAFKATPKVGMLGAYRRRGDGSTKDQAMAEKGKALISQLLCKKGLTDLSMVILLLKLIFAAKKNHYRLGDMCTGGSFFLSRAAYDRFRTLWPDVSCLQMSFLHDDLLFALHTAAAGYRLADFSDAEHVMAVNWRGLPMPLHELVSRRKKIVHPVKDPDDPTIERDIRDFFRERRKAEAAQLISNRSRKDHPM